MSTATIDPSSVPARAASDADAAIPGWLRDDSLGLVLATHPADALVAEFGPERVRACAIAEEAMVGMAIGAAVAGLHPLVDVVRSGFLFVAADQILNHLAQLRYLSDGQARLQVTVKALTRVRYIDDPQPAAYGCFSGQPGLKVAIPGNSIDAPGLLRSALDDPNPVLFFDSFELAPGPGQGGGQVPLGQARLLVRGADATLVAVGATTVAALGAARELAEQGVTCEVIDVLCLAPLDVATISQSLRRTGRLVVVDEAPYPAPAAQQIVATMLADDATFASLRCAPRAVSAGAAPLPASPGLRRTLLPAVADVVAVVLASVGASPPPAAAAPALP